METMCKTDTLYWWCVWCWTFRWYWYMWIHSITCIFSKLLLLSVLVWCVWCLSMSMLRIFLTISDTRHDIDTLISITYIFSRLLPVSTF